MSDDSSSVEGRYKRDVPDPEKQLMWELMRRDDLKSVVGVVFRMPFHGRNETGQWEYVLPPLYGSKNPDTAAEFEREMRQIVAGSAKPLIDAGILSETQVAAIEGHPYHTGPAAGDSWQYFFEIYQNIDVLLSIPANLIAIAEAVKLIKAGAQAWKQRRQVEIERNRGTLLTDPYLIPDPGPVWTLPSLVSLCLDDFVLRYGVHDVTITVYPRTRWGGYGSADHPGMGENYLIRLAARPYRYFHLVDGHGDVFEHYRTKKDDVQLLPIPDLLPVEHSGSGYRMPEQPREFVVRFPPSSNDVA